MAGERLVTPEAVHLDLQTATVATRALARFIDVVLQLLAAMVVSIGFAAVAGDSVSATIATTVVLLAVFFIRVAYPVVMETRVGGTVGHLAMGLRIVTMDGSPIRARQALTRAAVGIVEIEMTLGVVAFLVAASRHDGRRLGDLAAGTQAISVRVGTGPAQVLELAAPPRLQPWSEALDVTGLGQPERQALRRYHDRSRFLAPDAREVLAAALLDKLAGRLGVALPPSASAHEVLLAIAAATTTVAPAPRASAPAPDGFQPPT